MLFQFEDCFKNFDELIKKVDSLDVNQEAYLDYDFYNDIVDEFLNSLPSE